MQAKKAWIKCRHFVAPPPPWNINTIQYAGVNRANQLALTIQHAFPYIQHDIYVKQIDWEYEIKVDVEVSFSIIYWIIPPYLQQDTLNQNTLLHILTWTFECSVQMCRYECIFSSNSVFLKFCNPTELSICWKRKMQITHVIIWRTSLYDWRCTY